MKQQDLMLQFSPSCILNGKVAMILPADFDKMAGKDITGCHVFILVSRGMLQVEINGKIQNVKGDSLIDMMDWGNIRISHTSSDLCAYCLLPNREFTNESLANMKPCPDSYLVNRLYSPILVLSDQERLILERQLLLLASVINDKEHCYKQELAEIYFKGFMLELGNITMIRHKGNASTILASGKRDEIMTAFIRLVRQNFQTEHNVNFYAREIGISSKHLSRVIKEVMGKTPHEVICYEMIQYAITLLKSDKLSIGGIATDLCFYDQAAFSKFFKKWTGMSPGEYRKR